MNNNAKFEGKLTFHFKIDMRNLTNFDSSTGKSKKLSKKAVKLGSLIQCSVHLFLGHDGCFKNYFKNFLEPYHEELLGKT